MLLTLGQYAIGIRCRWRALPLLYAAAVMVLVNLSTASIYEGEPCTLMDSRPGICTKTSRCPEVEQAVKKGELLPGDIKRCSFDVYGEIICCPSGAPIGQQTPEPPATTLYIFDSASQSAKNTTPTKIVPTTKPRLNDRPAAQACRIIDQGLEPALTTHILDGTPVALGEYPHMAAIGYSRIGNDQGPYDFRCGGTLIDKRFVLTAAHCVSSRDSQPAIVRLGVTNFTNEEQMRNVVEIPIERTHIHPEYTNSRKYHDIALLELERDVELEASRVYPVCLYTELPDPPAKSWLAVAGWGTVNTRTREFSNILLQARLEIVPLDSCNETYVENGLNRQLVRGLEQTQLCAHDLQLTKDACQGDSGGPLIIVDDQSLKKYRVVGIISAGFSCATATPGLYTRVAAYLDFIEAIVWPTLT